MAKQRRAPAATVSQAGEPVYWESVEAALARLRAKQKTLEDRIAVLEAGSGGGGTTILVREVDGTPSITADTLEFDQSDGFVVTNPGGTVARVDFPMGAYVRRDGTTPLTANWDVGTFDITGIDDLAAATATFTGNVTQSGASPIYSLGGGTGSPTWLVNKSNAGDAYAPLYRVAAVNRWAWYFATNEDLQLIRWDSGGVFQDLLNIAAATGLWTFPSNVGGGGTSNFLRADGAWAAPVANLTGTTVDVDFGSTLIYRGRFTITDAAISATSKVMVWQAQGPYTGKGTRADEAEMDPIDVTIVYPAAGSAVVVWEVKQSVVPRWDQTESLLATLIKPNVSPQAYVYGQRIGRVRGHFRFHYAVFS